MLSARLDWNDGAGWTTHDPQFQKADLVLFFGEREALADGRADRELKQCFPDAIIVGCSTGGQIVGSDVCDGGVHAQAISFSQASARLAHESIQDARDSVEIGQKLGARLADPELACVLIISNGLFVNGAGLVEGVASAVGAQVSIVGGLAGDGAKFQETIVTAGDECGPHIIAAIGLYGKSLEVGHGNAGGWSPFGPMRSITRSQGNVLYEVDGEPALDLYERYLGPDECHDLPASGLLFPLRISSRDREDAGVVRTILGIDRATRSMTFAGDMPLGWNAQLMRGSNERLIEGAATAARQAQTNLTGPAQFSLLVSCIGRKLLMGQRIEEEVEAAADVLADGAKPFGFYSYGEISPQHETGFAQLHNQTMTVFLMRETVT
jgi:hypothetical protein